LRLRPGDDLKETIDKFVQDRKIQAGWIASAVGSLTDFSIRFANRKEKETGSGHFEIISLSGLLSHNGSHLHIGIAGTDGKVIGGHLLPGCIIYTTAELIIQVTGKYEFRRELDGTTEWRELQINEKQSP
jgi:predicted DNA-binding protein with PD1-like motif